MARCSVSPCHLLLPTRSIYFARCEVKWRKGDLELQAGGLREVERVSYDSAKERECAR